MALLSKTLHPLTKFKQLSAHFGRCGLAPFVLSIGAGNVKLLKEELSNSIPSYCQHRYPSPGRPVHFQNGPIDFGVQRLLGSADHRALALASLVFPTKRNNSIGEPEPKESGHKCSENHGSSQQQPASRLLDVYNQMAIGPSSAQVRAFSRLTSLVQIALGQQSSVQPLAHSVTTSAFATNSINSPFGAKIKTDRLWGYSSEAVLRSRDLSHV